jgi:hypothetical protein
VAEKNTLSFGEKTQALNWLQNNFDRVKPLSAEKAAVICKGEIGINVSGANLTGIARAVDLKLFTRATVVGIRNINDRHSVFACLARAIKDIHAQHGTVSSEHDNLTQIIGRYLDNVK